MAVKGQELLGVMEGLAVGRLIIVEGVVPVGPGCVQPGSHMAP